MISIRKLEDRDLSTVQAWLRLPHVAKWWGEPGREIEQMRSHHQIRYPHAMILDSDQAVGYLRWFHCDRALLDRVGFPDIPEGSVDIDIFIGDPSLVGKGIGSKAVTILLKELWKDPGVPLCGMSTSIENHPAIRAYEKAGFFKDRKFQDKTYGPCWLMIARRPEKD